MSVLYYPALVIVTGFILIYTSAMSPFGEATKAMFMNKTAFCLMCLAMYSGILSAIYDYAKPDKWMRSVFSCCIFSVTSLFFIMPLIYVVIAVFFSMIAGMAVCETLVKDEILSSKWLILGLGWISAFTLAMMVYFS